MACLAPRQATKILPQCRAATFARSFASTPSTRKYVSHIGKTPIPVPPTVTLTPTETDLIIKGPLGTTAVALHPFVKLIRDDPAVLGVQVEDPSVRQQRCMWGTTRTLIHNAIIGMTEGFNIPLFLVGVGFRAALEPDPRGTEVGNSGTRLNMKLGFAHSVFEPIPPYIKAALPTPTTIELQCTDKQRLGLFAAKIRRYRPPEPYKGKGVYIGDEQVKIKVVKKK